MKMRGWAIIITSITELRPARAPTVTSTLTAVHRPGPRRACRPIGCGLHRDDQRRRLVQHRLVRHQADHHPRHEHVQHRADDQRPENPAWQVALRVLRLLSRGRHRVEADEREEDHPRAAQHPAPPVLAECPGVRRQKRVPVGLVDEERAGPDHDQHDRYLDHHDDVVGGSRLTHADDQQCGDGAGDEDGGDVEDSRHRVTLRQPGRSFRVPR